jgi:predicted kinase
MNNRSLLPQQSLIVMVGVAGVGKSTIARALCERVHLTYLSTDPITDPFFPNTRESKEYQEMRPRIYEALYLLAAENLSLGNSVLLDAPHVTQMKSREWIEQITNLAKTHDAVLRVVRCWCSEEELRRRIMERGQERDAAKLANWKTFVADQPMRLPIPIDHVDVDTREMFENNISKILAYLS